MLYSLALVATALVSLSAAADRPIVPVPTGCPAVNGKDTVHLAHESDCTKYYKCDNGNKVLLPCPKPLQFNAILQVCDWECVPAPEPVPEPQPEPERPLDSRCPAPGPLNHTVHLPHATDCTKFFKCDNGRLVEFDCPEPLHFNAKLEVCDWPDQAGCHSKPHPHPHPPTRPPRPPVNPPRPPHHICPAPGPLNHTVHLPHPHDCTKFFKCDNGRLVEFDCPAPLHFNPKLEVCDWPDQAGCHSKPHPHPHPPTRPPRPPVNPPRPPHHICPAPGPLNHTVHLPHPQDCTKFFKCDNGRLVEFDCPKPLHFNPKLEVCDWPDQAGCSNEVTTPKPDPQIPTESPPPTHPLCPAPGPLNHTVHLPHPTDCTKFFKCDNGRLVEFDCPAPLHFNPKLQVCDWPDQAGCSNKVTTPKPDPQIPTESPPPPTHPLCPAPGPLNHTVHLPHPTDCTKFFKCDNGRLVEFDCPAPLHFNPKLEVCDWPDQAGCFKEVTTPKPDPQIPTESPPPPPTHPLCPAPGPLNHTVHLPHPTDCTKFFKCDNGRLVEFDCPAPLHFNPRLEVCDWPDQAGCSNEVTTPKPDPQIPTESPPPPPPTHPLCPAPGPLNHTVHLPHPTDCTKFFKCDNGRLVEFDCPAPLHFNPKLEVCDWPDQAGCSKEVTTPKPDPQIPTESPPPPPTHPLCPAPGPLNHTVHLPHPTDCTKFFKCDNGDLVEFDCPAPLHFNPKLEVCDWPDQAGCSNEVTTTPKPHPNPEPVPCPGEGGNIPHECECDKFYRCENGVKVLYQCAAGFGFGHASLECEIDVCGVS